MPISDLASRLANAILEMVEASEIKVGAHLSTPKLAERFDVSRSPVREALQYLADMQVVAKHAHRGYFVLDRAGAASATPRTEGDADPAGYRQITEDWLNDAIPAEVTEQFLRERYALSPVQLGKVLSLGVSEGWVERKGGYGWRLLHVAKTPESLEQIYRVRMMIEPAGLLEPTFHLDRDCLAAHRVTQLRLLDHGIADSPSAALVTAGAQFHEDVIRMSGNPFLHQTLVRLNRIRRLIEFRSMADRDRLNLQCRQHVEIVDLLLAGSNVEASHLIRRHLNGAITAKVALHRAYKGSGRA